MKSERWIDLSRRVYARLLKLYPSEHRREYGPSMLQVFTDQCREAWRVGGGGGLVAVWLRSLADLVVSSVREQLASPRAAWGLLEAVPNAPLPWKGVALVLIPGSIFLVAQIGQLTGQPWFLLMVYRAGYFLILPVLLIWAVTRRFPIWGLIPLGVLFNTAWYYGARLQNLGLDGSNPISSRLMIFMRGIQPSEKIVMVIGLLAFMTLFIWIAARRGHFTSGSRVWMGINLFLIAAIMVQQYLGEIWIFNHYKIIGMDLHYPFLQSWIARRAPYDFYNHSGFLVMILAGALLIRKYGRLALLLPLGYLLPEVLVGNLSADTPNLFWISAVVLGYRLLVALVAPAWIVRSASERDRKWAGTIALLVGIGIPIMMRAFTNNWWTWVGPSINDSLFYFFGSTSDLLITAAGIGLALALYRPSVRVPTESIPGATRLG